MLVCRLLTLMLILLCAVPVISGCGGSGGSGGPAIATGKDEEPVPLTKEQEDVERQNEKNMGGR